MSLNHRMDWIGRALEIILFQPPSWNKGYLTLDHVAQSLFQPDLEDFRVWEYLPVFLNEKKHPRLIALIILTPSKPLRGIGLSTAKSPADSTTIILPIWFLLSFLCPCSYAEVHFYLSRFSTKASPLESSCPYLSWRKWAVIKWSCITYKVVICNTKYIKAREMHH